MQPTMKLRWVERMEVLWRDPETQRCDGRTIKVLQQWWEHNPRESIGPGEWKDIEIQDEKNI